MIIWYNKSKSTVLVGNKNIVPQKHNGIQKEKTYQRVGTNSKDSDLQ